ncbi:PrgI family protein [Actinomadura sp. 7K507]|uniref:PrgI family protein n=1 Tax=Actinomadura sp. 7K507 TaxID=2530365 RepID=UPI001FB62035|nr:PrgI family protein [Actinomadura sp. 7K507]
MSEQYRVTIPANVERPDVIVANLTARQLAILIPAAAMVWLGYQATRTLLPLPVAAGFAVVVLGAAAALALAERDGVGLDRLLVFALAQRRHPRLLVPASDEPSVSWAAAGEPKGQATGRAAPLRLPVQTIGPDGVLDLGAEGAAAVVACSTVSFGLRTGDEQAGLVGAFAAWLNSLSGPAQILVRAQPIDLHPAIATVRRQAGGLPHPALEQAALEHADYLAELSASRTLLARQVLVVLREAAAPSGATSATGGSGGRSVTGASARVVRRAEQTTRALSAAGINAQILDAAQASAVLAQAADPTAPPMPPGAAAPEETITAAPDPTSGRRRRAHIEPGRR